MRNVTHPRTIYSFCGIMKGFKVAVIMTCDGSAEAIPSSPSLQKYQILWALAWFYLFFFPFFNHKIDWKQVSKNFCWWYGIKKNLRAIDMLRAPRGMYGGQKKQHTAPYLGLIHSFFVARGQLILHWIWRYFVNPIPFNSLQRKFFWIVLMTFRPVFPIVTLESKSFSVLILILL